MMNMTSPPACPAPYTFDYDFASKGCSSRWRWVLASLWPARKTPGIPGVPDSPPGLLLEDPHPPEIGEGLFHQAILGFPPLTRPGGPPPPPIPHVWNRREPGWYDARPFRDRGHGIAIRAPAPVSARGVGPGARSGFRPGTRARSRGGWSRAPTWPR